MQRVHDKQIYLDYASTAPIRQEIVEDAQIIMKQYYDLINYLAEKTEYISVGTDDDDNPYIELGKKDSDFKLRITNEKLELYDGSSTPAYISNQKLMIRKAEVIDEMQFGNFVWRKRPNGNMGLIWGEGNS